MNLAGYPPQFAAVLKAVLKELPTEKIAQLALYAGWEDSWERRDPTEEKFWDESLERLFDRTTKSGFKRMRHETAELVVTVGDQIVDERSAPQQGRDQVEKEVREHWNATHPKENPDG